MQAIVITHRYSKDHRPDLKQAVLELILSQDGGIPLHCQSWDGNASDNEVFKHQCEALIDQFQTADTPRYLIADSKLYTQANAKNLARLPFITRIPETLKVAQEIIDQAWAAEAWQPLDETHSYYPVNLTHYHINQRWLVVHSQSAAHRAKQTVDKAQTKEEEQIHKQLFHLQGRRFESEAAADYALSQVWRKWKYHKVCEVELIQHVKYAKKGRPTADTPIDRIEWQINAGVKVDALAVTSQLRRKSCYVIGTSIDPRALGDEEVILGYKNQSAVERGFKFLKSPEFFVSSLYVSKPSRIEGLLMVMTLALLVYSVAQRRLREALLRDEQTLPNQIGQPNPRPTLRWIFQLLEGIHRVVACVGDQVVSFIEGVTDLRRQILRLFGQEICHIYQISSA